MLEKTNKDIFVVRTAIKAFTIIVIAVMALTIITEIIIKEPYMVRTSVIIYETNAIINKAGTIDTIKIHGTIKITSDSGKGR
jgi:type IV secretory pathway component VirB8